MISREDREALVLTPEIRSLSFHAGYQCANTGACCRTDWPIAVEARIELRLRRQLPDVSPALPNDALGFVPDSALPDGCSSILRRTDTGVCWYRDEQRRSCAIHEHLGPEAQPSACRQFPRIAVIEGPSTALTLSHYCPTAADTLFDDPGAFEVVAEAASGGTTSPLEGLDVRPGYSPLLRPGVLLGIDGLRTLEKESVQTLSEASDVDSAIARIARAIASARNWTPDAGDLPATIRQAFEASSRSAAPAGRRVLDARRLILQSLQVDPGSRVIPESLPHAGLPVTPSIDRALRRYLAARLVGAWVTYYADDLSVTDRYLELCLEAVRIFAAASTIEDPAARYKEAIRSADFWIIHLCDPERLAANLR